MIRHRYTYRLYLDDLPSATVKKHNFKNKDTKDVGYHEGVPVGFSSGANSYISNELEFTVKIHKPADGKYRVIGFEVEPFSVSTTEGMQLLVADTPITFSYSFKTVIDPQHKWATRMDHYMKFNSHYETVYHEQLLVIAITLLLLTTVVSQIIWWILRKDYEHLGKL